MNILSIESSCDETAAAVVADGRRILSSVVASQVDEHKIYGGVVPEIASRRHTEAICAVVNKAVADSNLSLGDIDAVGVTFAPGLIGALLVGVNYAKSLAYSLDAPLVPVHHLRGHVAANYLTYPDLEPPFLALIVSGGHSHLALVKSYTNFVTVAKTRDDAAGEALDKAARTMGLPYPGGLNLDKECKNGNPKLYKFPKPVVHDAPLDFSFSGLKTSVINIIHNAKQKGEQISVPDLGASFMEAVTNLLVDHTCMAAKQFDQNKIVLAGGVSANSVLRRKMAETCRKNGWQLYLPELKYCGDNAAMIGSQAYYEYLAGNTAGLDLNAEANLDIRLQTSDFRPF